MGSWPEGVPHPPTPQKPEGIADWEWDLYLDDDPTRHTVLREKYPNLRDKVEAALGWKKDDVDDARQIAEQVLGAVKIAEKGHVPEERRAMASLRDVILSHQPTKERRAQLFCRCGTWFSAQHQLDALRAAGFETREEEQ